MILTIKDGTSPSTVEGHINKAINHDSRFKVKGEVIGITRLKLRDVRLKTRKEYCGNHPNACEVGGGKPRKGVYLEGADWVSLNDILNDVLDALNANAWVRSSVCEIRRGRSRRINYDSHREFNQYEWNRFGDDGDYEDYCGVIAPSSTYPFGTPGIYSRDYWDKIQEFV